MNAPRLVIVGCVAAKLERRAPARELYTSPLFLKRRAYAEASGAPWAIYSALYGLVWPERELEPYDVRMDDLPRWRRESLGRSVACEIRHRLGWELGHELEGLVLELHTGAAYRETLELPVAWEAWRGWSLEAPLAGLGIGEQLGWYKRRELERADLKLEEVAA